MILNLIKNFDEGGKIRTNIVQVDTEKYLNQKFEKVLLFKTGKGFGNIFFKSVAYFNYALINNMMFCIDFDKYADFNYDEYFDKKYDIEFKKFIEKNPNCKVITTPELPNNHLTDNLGFYYEFWAVTKFNSMNNEFNKFVSEMFSNIFNFLFPVKNIIKYKFPESNQPEIGLQIRFGSYLGGCSNSNKYFCNQQGLNKFIDIIKNSNNKFYIATDNCEVKKHIKEYYKEKIFIFEHDLDHPYECSSETNFFSISEIINLSKCKKLYITGGDGNDEKCMKSSFGLVSSILNNIEYEWINNDA